MTSTSPLSSTAGTTSATSTTSAHGQAQALSQDGRVVVGYDGSAPSIAALDWAVAEAERRDLPLTVMHVWDPSTALSHAGARQDDAPALPGPALPGPAFPGPALPGPGWPGLVAAGTERAREAAPGVDIGGVTHVARIATTLMTVSETAELLVLGTHGHISAGHDILGSVAYAVAAHALCPVVIVRGEPGRRPGPGHPVIVGVDGSLGADRAAMAAATMATAAGAALDLITVYPSAPADPDEAGTGSVLSGGDLTELSRRSAEAAGRIAARCRQAVEAADPALAVSCAVLEGHPGKTLVSRSATAGLLVLGSRGWGGILGMLGSVTHWAIHRSACPVMVIPATYEDPHAISTIRE